MEERLDPLFGNTARLYISQHGLENLFAEMLNSLVFEKTRDPDLYMVLLNKY